MKKTINALFSFLKHYWQHNLWHKIVVVSLSIFLLVLGTMYGIAQWYIATNSHKPLTVGVSFVPEYATRLNVDPKETMDALTHDVGVRHFRLVSWWDNLEAQQGKYDFSLLDWQFQKAEASGSTVTLSLGLRQPRWPECHMPAWAKNQPQEVWQPQLEAFIGAVVERYKNSPALISYQLENEYFLQGFGECTNFDRNRLVSEYNLVKKLDSSKPLIITRSNNALGIPLGDPRPDMFGVSIYKRVWDSTLRTHRYLEYPFPAWFYAFMAGTQKIVTGRDMIIHELQAEAWPPNNQFISDISLEEQNKSFNAERFKDRIEFGKGTGMREMYLWGAEYWYYRVVHEKDTSVWNVAKDIFKQ